VKDKPEKLFPQLVRPQIFTTAENPVVLPSLYINPNVNLLLYALLLDNVKSDVTDRERRPTRFVTTHVTTDITIKQRRLL
jgi:hypothetical protein